VTSLYYAAFMKVKKQKVTEWDEKHCRWWDSAIQGSSALKAALIRRLVCELAGAQNLSIADIFLDLAKFYDSISIPHLVSMASDLDYDMTTLAVGLEIHTADRFLRDGANCSKPISIRNSILQGCLQSNALARVTLYNILEDLHYKLPKLHMGQHVDDLSHHSHGTQSHVYHDSLAATRFLQDRLADIGLAIAGHKTFVVASPTSLAKKICKALRATGLEVRTTTSTRDLGTDAGTGRNRATAVFRGRSQKGSIRSKRIAIITRATKRTSIGAKLYITGLKPSSAYGSAAYGQSPTTISKLRAQAVTALGIQTPRACTTTCLHLSMQSDLHHRPHQQRSRKSRLRQGLDIDSATAPRREQVEQSPRTSWSYRRHLAGHRMGATHTFQMGTRSRHRGPLDLHRS
jgi:hypothetical protein